MSEAQNLPAEQPKTQLPFQAPSLSTGITKASEKIEMQRVTAEVYAAFQLAQARPRNEEFCYEKIMKLCRNVRFASEALYRVPRGGDQVEGIGVKGAAEFARVWGNLHTGYVEHGRYKEESQFKAFAQDLETNWHHDVTFTVRHERQSGTWKKEDQLPPGVKVGDPRILELVKPQDIDEVCKARAAKEVRNAILRVIPRYILEEAFAECRRTLHAEVPDVKAAMEQAVAAFDKLGIKEDSLWQYCNAKPGDGKFKYQNLTAADIVDLRLLHKEIRETPSLADYYFPERDKKVALPEGKPPEAGKVQTSKPGTAAGKTGNGAPAAGAAAEGSKPPAESNASAAKDAGKTAKDSASTTKDASSAASEPGKSTSSTEQSQAGQTTSSAPASSSASSAEKTSETAKESAEPPKSDAPSAAQPDPAGTQSAPGATTTSQTTAAPASEGAEDPKEDASSAESHSTEDADTESSDTDSDEGVMTEQEVEDSF